MKKKGGKLKVPHKEVTNIKMELRRAEYERSRKSSTGDMNSDINSMVEKIHAEDGKIGEYLKTTDSKYSEDEKYVNLKKRIEETREGSGVHGVNCMNLDKHYLKYKEGKYDAFCFLCDIEKLFGELNRECNELLEWFAYGHIERKEAEHEGVDSVFGI